MAELIVIGKIHTPFKEKFGIPRQSGLVPEAKGVISFLPAYRQKEAFRGLEDFSHIIVLWDFSKAKQDHFAATVAPPRLGGKTKMGVFATRSPFRPNSIGLSVLALERIQWDDKKGPLLHVAGVDLLDGTPIYDIKPYLPYADAYPEAKAGFGGQVYEHELSVTFAEGVQEKLPPEHVEAVTKLLAQDPRTAYIEDETRVWGLAYEDYNIKFTVQGDTLTVADVEMYE